MKSFLTKIITWIMVSVFLIGNVPFVNAGRSITHKELYGLSKLASVSQTSDVGHVFNALGKPNTIADVVLDEGITTYKELVAKVGDVISDVKNRLGPDIVGKFKAGVFDGTVYLIFGNCVYRYASNEDKVYRALFSAYENNPRVKISDELCLVGGRKLGLKIYKILEEDSELTNFVRILADRLIVGDLKDITPCVDQGRRLFRFQRYIHNAVMKALVESTELPTWNENNIDRKLEGIAYTDSRGDIHVADDDEGKVAIRIIAGVFSKLLGRNITHANVYNVLYEHEILEKNIKDLCIDDARFDYLYGLLINYYMLKSDTKMEAKLEVNDLLCSFARNYEYLSSYLYPNIKVENPELPPDNRRILLRELLVHVIIEDIYFNEKVKLLPRDYKDPRKDRFPLEEGIGNILKEFMALYHLYIIDDPLDEKRPMLRYFVSLFTQFMRSIRGKVLEIGKNFKPSAMLSPEQREELLGAVDYGTVRTEENLKAAKNVHIYFTPLDGGIGEGIRRDEHLRMVFGKEMPLGAKGTDLHFRVYENGNEYWFSILEVKLLNLLKEMDNYKIVILKELGTQKVSSSIQHVFNKHIPPLSSIPEDIRGLTYHDALLKRGIRVLSMDIQQEYPKFKKDSEVLTPQHTVHGGHGGYGVKAFLDILDTELGEDESLVRAIYNGDGINNSPDPYMIGWMVREHVPVVMVTTTKTPLDMKGGQIGVYFETGKKPTIQIMEQKQAQNVGQAELFAQMGLRDGDGHQYFNTNMVLINYTVLKRFLEELIDTIGLEQFFGIIRPDAITKEGTEYISFEGALGSVILNLNAFLTNTTNRNIINLMDRYGITRFLRIINVDVAYRTDFFTPSKVPFDFWLEGYSNHFRLDTDSWRLINNNPGHLPSAILGDRRYNEIQFLIDKFRNVDVLKLESLEIERGVVDISDTELVGRVIIYNISDGVVSISDFRSELIDYFNSETGKLRFENCCIILDSDRVYIIKDISSKDKFSSRWLIGKINELRDKGQEIPEILKVCIQQLYRDRVSSLMPTMPDLKSPLDVREYVQPMLSFDMPKFDGYGNPKSFDGVSVIMNISHHNGLFELIKLILGSRDNPRQDLDVKEGIWSINKWQMEELLERRIITVDPASLHVTLYDVVGMNNWLDIYNTGLNEETKKEIDGRKSDLVSRGIDECIAHKSATYEVLAKRIADVLREVKCEKIPVFKPDRILPFTSGKKGVRQIALRLIPKTVEDLMIVTRLQDAIQRKTGLVNFIDYLARIPLGYFLRGFENLDEYNKFRLYITKLGEYIQTISNDSRYLLLLDKIILSHFTDMGDFHELVSMGETQGISIEELRSQIEGYSHKGLIGWGSHIESEDMHGQMERLYGEEYSNAVGLNALRFANVGFETSKDKKTGEVKMINRLGWTIENLRWLFNNQDKVKGVLDDAEAIRKRYRYVILCGMGGSGLSVQTVKETFGEPEGLKIFSLRSTDPAVISDILDEITRDSGSLEVALQDTLVIPISKSGTTEETVRHKEYFEDLFAKYSIDPKQHMWVITDKDSPMDTGDYIQREIQLNGKGDIGGRFTSPTTRIFLLPLALVAPERVWDVLKQAKEINEVSDIKKDTFIKLGVFLYHMAADLGKDKVTFFMSEEFKELPSWAEQLFEESLGKQGKGVTLFYGENINSNVLRSVEENDRVFIRVNLGKKKTQDELWDYLVRNNYPVFEIDAKDINSIGGIMLGLQRAVATIGYLWDICFVDQPAVEGYEKKTREIMRSIQPGQVVTVDSSWKSVGSKDLKLYYEPLLKIGAITEDELESEVNTLNGSMDNAPAVYAAIINILRRKPGFEAMELTSYGRMTSRLRDIMEDVRHEIFTRLFKMPFKLGEGPDKNHSYQQNIEDGKNMFFSTYILPLIPHQPSALAFDENLLKAQAIGTVKSMVDNRRKVVLITLGSDVQSGEAKVTEFFDKVKSYLMKGTGVVKSPIAKILGKEAEYKEIYEITVEDGRLTEDVSVIGQRGPAELEKAGMGKVIGKLVEIYGPGILAVVDGIRVVDNIKPLVGLSPYGMMKKEDGRNILLLDVDAFSNEELLYIVLEHELKESIMGIVPVEDDAIRELTTNFMSLKLALEKGVKIDKAELEKLGVDLQFFEALEVLQAMAEVTDEQILAVAIEHMRGMPYYSGLFKQFPFAEKWEAKIKDAENRYKAALQVFNEIAEAKEMASKVKETKEKADRKIRGLSESIRKIRMVISNKPVWEIGFVDALVRSNKFILLDRDELNKPENKYIMDWINGIRGGKKKSPFIFSDEGIPEGVNPEDIIYLIEPEKVNKKLGEGRLYLPLPYSVSSIYLAGEVVLADGKVSGIRDKLVVNTIMVLYETLIGRDITELELEQLFRTPWTILPPIAQITATLDALRKAIVEVETSA